MVTILTSKLWLVEGQVWILGNTNQACVAVVHVMLPLKAVECPGPQMWTKTLTEVQVPTCFDP